MNTCDWWPCDLQTTAMAMYDDLLAFSGFPAPSSLPIRTPAAMETPNGICDKRGKGKGRIKMAITFLP